MSLCVGLGRSHQTLLAASGFACLLFTGCFGSSEPYSYIKESGSVVYEDGSPIPCDRLIIKFIPQDAKPIDQKTAVPNGSAQAGGDGKFDAITSHKPGDGLSPGTAKVILQALDNKERELNVIPKEYKSVNTTPLIVDTAKPETFNLKVKKPAPGAVKGK